MKSLIFALIGLLCISSFAEPTPRLYQALELDRTATRAQIFEAYTKIRKGLDSISMGRGSEAEAAQEKLRQIGEAWHVLKDENRRQHYSRYGDNGARLLDFVDHETIETVRAALQSDGPWDSDEALQTVVRFYLNRTASMARFLVLDPVFGYGGTARYYDGEKAKSFYAFLHRLHPALIEAYKDRGNGKSLINTGVAEELVRQLQPEAQEMDDSSGQVSYYELSLNAELASKLVADLKLCTPDLFKVYIDNYFMNSTPETPLKFLDPRFLDECAPFMTAETEALFFHRLIHTDEELNRVMPRHPQMLEQKRPALQARLLATLLHSRLINLDVRKNMFRFLVDKRYAFVGMAENQKIRIAAFFISHGNSAEAKHAEQILHPFLEVSWVDGGNDFVHISYKRTLATLALLQSRHENIRRKALQSVTQLLEETQLDSLDKIGLLKSALHEKVLSQDLQQLFESYKDRIIPRGLPDWEAQLYKPEARAGMLKIQVDSIEETIQTYTQALKSSCHRALGD